MSYDHTYTTTDQGSIMLNNALEISKTDHIQCHFEQGMETYRVINIWHDREMIVCLRVGKSGKPLSVNRHNIKYIRFSWLALGHKLGNLEKLPKTA